MRPNLAFERPAGSHLLLLPSFDGGGPAAGNTAAELVLIKSGTLSPDRNNPCRSGYHMYFGAGPDVAKVLDQFMNNHLVSR